MRFSVEALLTLVVVAVLVREARVQAATVYITIGAQPWLSPTPWDGLCDDTICSVGTPCLFDPMSPQGVDISVRLAGGGGTTGPCTVFVVGGAIDPGGIISSRFWNVELSVSPLEVHFSVGMGSRMLFIRISSPMVISADSGVVLSGAVASIYFQTLSAQLSIKSTFLKDTSFFLYPNYAYTTSQPPLVTVEDSTIERTASSPAVTGPLFLVQPPTSPPPDPSHIGLGLLFSTCKLSIAGATSYLVQAVAEVPNLSLELKSVTTTPYPSASAPLMRSDSSTGISTLSISGSSNIISSADSLVSTNALGAQIYVVDSANVACANAQSVSPSTNAFLLYVYGTGTIQGFSLAQAAITLDAGATIANCDLSLISSSSSRLYVNAPSLNSYSSPSIVFDPTSPYFKQGRVLLVRDSILDVKSGAVLNLPSLPSPASATAPYQFSGTSSIGSLTAAGLCTVKAYTISSQGATTITSLCHLVITGGLSAPVSPSLNGDGTSVGSVPAAGLELHAGATYDAIIDLSTWNLFSVAINPSEQLTTPAIRGSTTGSLQIANRPQSIRVIWPSDSLEEPQQNVNYFLFDTIMPLSLTTSEDSYTTSEDRYRFTIVFTRPDASSNIARVVAILPATSPPLHPSDTSPSFPSSSPPPDTSPQPIAPTPSSLFQCSNRQCTSITSISQPVVILPPNSNTVIDGNLTATTLIFDGLGSSISVKGCISSDLSYITLELSAEDLKKLQSSKDQSTSSPLVHVDPASQSSSSCESSVRLDDINVSVKVKDGGCKKVKFSRKTSADGLTLSAILTLDNSKCNLWWIILSSVLGGVVLIAIVVVVLLVSLVPSIRHKIRPYSKKRVAN